MYVVTGGAGFIGSAFVARLNQDGISDVLVVDEFGTSDKWRNLVGLRFSDYIHKDRFLEHLRSGHLAGRISGIVHMGACSATTETNLDYLIENNYRYTCALAEYALERGVRFVYASSAATYGDGAAGYSDDPEKLTTLRPLNRYGYSKQLFDLWALKQGYLDRIAGIKFFNVFGPNEYHKGDMRSVVHKAYQQVRTAGKVRLFRSYRPDYADGEQKRDFVYVRDCTEIMLWLLNSPDVNGIYNLGSGRARSWNDLAKAVFAAMGREPSIEYIDMPGELTQQYQYFTQADLSRLRAAGCKHDFLSLEESVREFVVDYLESGQLYL